MLDEVFMIKGSVSPLDSTHHVVPFGLDEFHVEPCRGEVSGGRCIIIVLFLIIIILLIEARAAPETWDTTRHHL